MAEPHPGFFARICCCSREEKEPPVTLIRSNDVPAPIEQTTITPATETVDGFEDQQLEVGKDEKGPKEEFRGKAPKWKIEQKQETILEESKEFDQMNLNDLMMNDICGEEQEKPSLEDAVSIRTNVIEEVDESELRQMSEILKKDLQLEERKDEPQTSSRSAEVVTLQQILLEGYDSPRVTNGDETPAIQITPAVEGRALEDDIEEMQEITNSRPSKEEDESDSELEEEIVLHETTQSTAPTASPRSILKTSPSNPSSARTDGSEDVESSRKDDSEEDEAPPDLPDVPPPEHETLEGLHHAVLVNVEDEPKRTLMYADADSSSDDDEAEREVLPPVAKPEETDVEDEEAEEGWEDKSEKENQVTRLSVKSNGQASLTTGGVRVALEAVEITDDEFSEKLI